MATIDNKEAGFAILNFLHGAKPVSKKHAQPKPVAKQPEPAEDPEIAEYHKRQEAWLRIDNDLLFREI